MTRCVIENEAGERTAIKVEAHETGEGFPGGGVTIRVEGAAKVVDSALHRSEALVLLHTLAHVLDFDLIDKHHARRLLRQPATKGRRKTRAKTPV